MMRKAAPVCWAIVACALHGCATTRSGGNAHPGVQDLNPNAVNRVYPASATRVAWATAQVMMKDPILEDVKLMVDPQSNESRPLSHAEKEALGISSMNLTARDVNYNIRARSKDGHAVGAVVQLKDDSSAEVTLLYGVAGDKDLSRAILDEVDVALKGPVKNPGLWKATGPKAGARKPEGQ